MVPQVSPGRHPTFCRWTGEGAPAALPAAVVGITAVPTNRSAARIRAFGFIGIEYGRPVVQTDIETVRPESDYELLSHLGDDVTHSLLL
jgi:hypothetical protein